MFSRRIFFLFILICIGFFLLVNYLSTKTKPKIGTKQAESQIRELENRTPFLESQIISEDPLVWVILLAKNINDPYLETHTLTQLADTYLDIGRDDKAMELVSEAFQIAKRIKAAPGWKEAALEEIITLYIKLRQYEKALEIAETVKDDLTKINTLARISAEFKRLEQEDKASVALIKELQKLEKKESVFEKVDTLINIADVYKEVGQKQKSMEFFNQAIQTLENLKNTFGYPQLWCKIAEKYIEQEEYDEAFEIIRALKNYAPEGSHVGDEGLEKIAEGFTETGNIKKALEITEMIMPSYRKIEVLSKIVDVYIKAGQSNEAAELLSQTVQVSQSIGLAGKATILGDLAVKYVKIDQYEKAIQIVDNLDKIVEVGGMHFKFEAFVKIAKHYQEIGDKFKSKEFLDQALQVARTETRYLIEIAGKYIVAGETEKASELVTQVIHLVEAKEDNITKVERFIEIADFYIATGQNDKALEFLSKALWVAQKINKITPISKDYVLDSCHLELDEIAIKCVKLKHYEMALQATKAILLDGLTLHTLTKIGVIFAKDGHRVSKDESKILQEIIDKFK